MASNISDPTVDSETSKTDESVPQVVLSDAPVDNKDSSEIVAEGNADADPVVEPTDTEGSSDLDFDSIKRPTAPGDKARGSTNYPTSGKPGSGGPKRPPNGGLLNIFSAHGPQSFFARRRRANHLFEPRLSSRPSAPTLEYTTDCLWLTYTTVSSELFDEPQLRTSMDDQRFLAGRNDGTSLAGFASTSTSSAHRVFALKKSFNQPQSDPSQN
ncbi:hypothetical protein C8R45DRAFT_927189 [Mycena sanguinolenta]|nr:hypothetical protein C8R45DRAFT_927189 [Mycena sanguinolenta]